MDLAGLLTLASDDDLEGMTRLAEGKLEQVSCLACSQKLEEAPFLCVTLTRPRDVYLALGDGKTARDEGLVAAVRQLCAREHGLAITREFTTFQELYTAVRAHLATYLKQLDELWLRIRMGNSVMDHWGLLTPEAVVAGELLATGHLPANLIELGLRYQNRFGDPGLRLLAAWQAESWLGLAGTWAAGEAQSFRLESALQRYLRPGAILVSAVERFSRAADLLEKKPDAPFTLSFCCEAIRATVLQQLGHPNPKAGLWAYLFFRQELLLRKESLLDRTPRQVLKELSISAERARATIAWNEAWPAFIACAGDDWPGNLEALYQASVKAGHPQMLTDFFHGMRWTGPGQLPLETALKILRQTAEQLSDPESVAEVMDFTLAGFKSSLLPERRVDVLERLADEAPKIFGGSDVLRAVADSWLGSCLLELREPLRLLNRLGSQPRDWEARLDPRRRDLLQNLRMNALDLMEQPGNVLPAPLPLEARIDQAIRLETQGAPDETRRTLLALLPETTTALRRLTILESLVRINARLGNDAEALGFVDEALSVPRRASTDEHRRRLLLYKARLLIGTGKLQPAIELLLSLRDEPSVDPLALLQECWAWLNLMDRGELLPKEVEPRLRELQAASTQLLREARARGDMQLVLAALSVHAHFAERTGAPKSELLWSDLVMLSDALGKPPDTSALLALARHAYLRGEPARARGLLERVPSALSGRLGRVTDLSAALQEPMDLHGQLDQVTRLVLQGAGGAGWDDIRLAAELRREAVTRSMVFGRGSEGAFVLPAAAMIARLASPHPLAVLEWVHTVSWVGALVTCVGPEGTVSTHWLSPPEGGNLPVLARRMKAKLDVWDSHRPGEPFDLPAWRDFERWLGSHMEPLLPEGGHLVVLEAQGGAGLPWHVAAAARGWSCSYAASWSSLLGGREPPERPDVQSVGIAVVPGISDEPAVVDALYGSAHRTEIFARSHGMRVVRSEGTRCDAAQLTRLMESTHVAKLLCHGFSDGTRHEVGVMLAARERLPLINAKAVRSPAGMPHQFGWQHFGQLRAAPRTIFSGACSSGVAYLAGVGERLGLFTFLRMSGARALVAPRWDVLPAEVLPILDDALERFLTAGEGLGRAVYDACRSAESKVPRWSAWALSLEGDWR